MFAHYLEVHILCASPTQGVDFVSDPLKCGCFQWRCMLEKSKRERNSVDDERCFEKIILVSERGYR